MKKLFIIFAVLCLAVPAMAADWNFYGSARMATFSVDEDADDGSDSLTNTQWAQQGNSRFGGTVKVNDQIGGAFEYGTGVNLRKLYGTYTFGNGGELLLGQTYTPSSSLFYSDSVFDGDGDMLGVGEFYVGRVPMIQFKMAGFKVALISPATQGWDAGDADYATYDAATDTWTSVGVTSSTTGAILINAASAYDTEVTIPKIEAAYHFKSDMFFADVFAGYQTYTVKAVQDVDVDSYVFGGGVGANFGAFYVKVGAHMGTNLGNYGAYNPVELDNAASLNATDTDVIDADGMGYLAVAGFTVSEMLNIEAGYGHEEAEVDNSNNTEEAQQMYVNCTITIAPGFFIVPEVGVITYSDDVSSEEPEVTYFGAKWQINF